MSERPHYVTVTRYGRLSWCAQPVWHPNEGPADPGAVAFRGLIRRAVLRRARRYLRRRDAITAYRIEIPKGEV